MATSAGATPSVSAQVREGEYGERVATIEPGGAEFIPLTSVTASRSTVLDLDVAEPRVRHRSSSASSRSCSSGCRSGRPSLPSCSARRSARSTHGLLPRAGPQFGVPQMIQSRIPLRLPRQRPACRHQLARSRHRLVRGQQRQRRVRPQLADPLPKWLCLVIVVAAQIAVAFLGHNLVHVFERYAFPPWASSSARLGLHPGQVAPRARPAAAARRLPARARRGVRLRRRLEPVRQRLHPLLAARTDRRARRAWSGSACSCPAYARDRGCALGHHRDAGRRHADRGLHLRLPTLVADLTLLAIAVGAVSANAINIYSGIDVLPCARLPAAAGAAPGDRRRRLRRARVPPALSGLDDPSRYENFLLIIAYWIGPWLGVVFADWYLRRGHRVERFLFDTRHNPWAGWVAMSVAWRSRSCCSPTSSSSSATWCRRNAAGLATSRSRSASCSPRRCTGSVPVQRASEDVVQARTAVERSLSGRARTRARWVRGAGR